MATALHEVIESRRELIVERYAAEVSRRFPPRAPASPADIRDDVSALLTQLVAALRTDAGLEAARAAENPGRTHGVQRFQLRSRVVDLISEYGVLGRVIVDAADEAGLAVTNAEFRVLGEVLNTAVRGAVEEFVAGAEAERHREQLFRERFIAILGHDLRTPLNAVVFGAGALLRADLNEAQTSVVRRVLRSAERMARMIDAVLDFARGRAGAALPIERSAVDVAGLVRAVVDELHLAHPERHFEVEAAAAVVADVDRDRLAQAVSNLVANAVAYGARDAPVLVRLRDEAGALAIDVHNEGDPIAAETIATLFDPFRRGSHGRSARPSGLGLGLFIARQVALAHGGRIDVRSSADEGTTFTLVVPRAPEVGGADEGSAVERWT